jgi:hypothetical protein
VNRAAIQQRYTPEEYVELEDNSEFKLEFFDGEVLGASPNEGDSDFSIPEHIEIFVAEQTIDGE